MRMRSKYASMDMDGTWRAWNDNKLDGWLRLVREAENNGRGSSRGEGDAVDVGEKSAVVGEGCGWELVDRVSLALVCDASSSSMDSSRSGRSWSFAVAICWSRLASRRRRVCVGYVARSRWGEDGRLGDNVDSGEAGRGRDVDARRRDGPASASDVWPFRASAVGWAC